MVDSWTQKSMIWVSFEQIQKTQTNPETAINLTVLENEYCYQQMTIS